MKLEDPTLTTGSSAGAITSYKKWSIIDEETGSLKDSSNIDILVGAERYIPKLGLIVKIKQVSNPGSEDGESRGEVGPDQFDGQGMAHAHPRHQEVCRGLPGDVR